MPAMLSVTTARQLREAGLTWTPAPLDFFAIPGRGMDDKVFVISDMLVTLEQLQGQPVFTFQGAMEWALDYLTTGEAIWLPGEGQLRAALAQYLAAEIQPAITLQNENDVCRCEIHFRNQALTFAAPNAAEAYAMALLHVLENSKAGYLH